MRKKTESKRQAILDMAAELFRESGFERASMSELCSRVGGSKATIYNYFASKEELLFEVVVQATEAEFQATHEALDPSQRDITQALQNFGERFLTLIYSPPVQAVRRLVVSEAGRSDLGRRCFEIGPARSMAEVAEFLQQAMHQGQLKQADPGIACLHLKGLLEAEWLYRFMFHTLEAPSPQEIVATVQRAVAVFMAAYGAQPARQSLPVPAS